MYSRLSIGTVQFGLPYGVANRSGQIESQEGAEILRRAHGAGIDTLDTAISYGVSEQQLGDIGVADWHIVTKLPAFPATPATSTDVAAWVRQSTSESLARLRVTVLRGLLLHRAADLAGAHGSALFEAMSELKREGMVQQIGVSIYDPSELAPIVGRFAIDLVQAPFSVVDRRLESSGWLQHLSTRGIEVHTRSVFLQGLLLMGQAARPAYFDKWRTLWQRWDRWLVAAGLSPLRACIGFALSRPHITRMVVGVDTCRQLSETLDASAQALVEPVPAELACDDPELVNPFQWPKA